MPQPWNGGYLDSVQANGMQDLHLLGWTGDYNDAGNFIGTFFGRGKPEFGLHTTRRCSPRSRAADAVVDPAGHAAAYEQVNRDLMTKYLPAVPICSSPPALVVRRERHGSDPVAR